MESKELLLKAGIVLGYDKANGELLVLCVTTERLLFEKDDLDEIIKYKDEDGKILIYRSCRLDIWPLQDYIQCPSRLSVDMRLKIDDFDFMSWDDLKDIEMLSVWNDSFTELFSWNVFKEENK